MHYSLKGILSLESHIDVMIQYFCQRLEENFIDAPNGTQICDIGEWISFCKSSHLSYSKKKSIQTNLEQIPGTLLAKFYLVSL
jgi:hypothetical protein